MAHRRRLVTGHFLLWAFVAVACDHTTYAPGYSEAAFKQVEIGMSRGEVEALLGEALATEDATPGEVWIYGDPNGKHQGPRTWKFALAGLPVVSFAQNGVVVAAYDAPGIGPGMSLERVRSLLGEPAERHLLKDVLVLHYSVPGDSGHSEIRIIGIDSKGRVSTISSYATDD
jgi:outer membrane protein assembly factor BamE (lipoprotein component of BamABCDE complex)